MRPVGIEAALLATLFVIPTTACPAPGPAPEPVRLPGYTTHRVTGDRTPGVSADFDRPPQLADPLPGDPRVLGADYLELAAAAIQVRWGSFLEDLRLRLPPHHALNSPGLVTVLTFVVGDTGAISGVQVETPSGDADFDQAAIDVLGDAGPLAAPPPAVRGDDGVVRLRWSFARDARQAGVATARVTPIRWPPERAVPPLVAAGELAAAAARLGSASTGARASLAEPTRAALVTSIADGVLQRAIGSPRPDVAASAMRAAASLHKTELTEPIAAHASAPGGVARPAALAALAVLGGAEAASIGRAVALDDSSSEAVASAAARTWATASKGLAASDDRHIESQIAALLASDDPARRRRAFVLAGATPVRAARRSAISLLGNGGDSLAVPVLARLAVAGDREAIRHCVAGLAASGAETRLAYARALGSSTGMRARSGALGRALRGRQRDADERVRAAAIAAMRPSAVVAAWRGWKSESSPLVRVALARALANASGARATRALGALTRHADASVRAAAARGLWGRKGAAALLAPLRKDRDPVVRAAALAALSAEELARRARSERPGGLEALVALETLGVVDSTLVADLLATGDEAKALAAATTWLRTTNRAKLER